MGNLPSQLEESNSFKRESDKSSIPEGQQLNQLKHESNVLENSMESVPATVPASVEASQLTISASPSNSTPLDPPPNEKPKTAPLKYSENELWDIFWSGEAITIDKKWPWSRLYHQKKNLTFYWNERENIVQVESPAKIFGSFRDISVEGNLLSDMLTEYQIQILKRREDAVKETFDSKAAGKISNRIPEETSQKGRVAQNQAADNTEVISKTSSQVLVKEIDLASRTKEVE